MRSRIRRLMVVCRPQLVAQCIVHEQKLASPSLAVVTCTLFVTHKKIKTERSYTETSAI
jgi:hypothetical protein